MSDLLKKVATAVAPLLLAALGFLYSSMMEVRDQVSVLHQKMSILVDMDNKIIPSPDNAIARMQIKDDVMKSVNELDKRIAIIEWRIDNDKKGGQ
jgi:hypothetical protein